MADLGFSPEEWYFFVVKDEREAVIEIHTVQKPVIVEIELTGPGSGGTFAGKDQASPFIRPAPKPPPEDDGDGEGEEVDDYEGGDD